jgi:hypothetical protein
LTSTGLFIQAFSFFCPGRPGCDALFWLGNNALHEFAQPLQGICPISFTGPVLLGFDHDDALAVDPVILQSQQPVFVLFREGGSRNIEAQVYGAGYLVYVLPPGALGAYGPEFDLTVAYGQGGGSAPFRPYPMLQRMS